MKPIQLIMTAFGPYKQTEVIDFSELGEHRLFSISGNTGAGKTTIFDGICYALYGEASGEERSDASMLRSHFADDSVHTRVELTFQIKQKTYYIVRQMGHKKKGNKTATGGAIEFYEVVNSERVPCVDRMHVTDINQKVEGLIGLNKHQFSQIVMLPQGEFRKLLTSETENKEEILRRIFKTDRYKLMREVLDGRRKELKAQLEKKQNERDIHIRNVLKLPVRAGTVLETLHEQAAVNSFQVIRALDEECAFYKAEFERLLQSEERQQDVYRETQERYHLAKAINEKLQEASQKKEQYEALAARRPAIVQKETRLRSAEEANRLAPFEETYHEAAKLEEEARKRFAEMSDKTARVKEQLRELKVRYEQEEEKERQRDQAKQAVMMLEEVKPLVEMLSVKETELASIYRTMEEAKNSLNSAEQRYTHLVQGKKKLQEDIRILEPFVQQLHEKKEALAVVREDAKDFMRYDSVVKELQHANAEWAEAEKDAERINREYDEAEQQWLAEQAGQLAAHLTDGSPCPVCGSAEHPNKASSHESSVTDQYMKGVRERKRQADSTYYLAEGKRQASLKQHAHYRAVLVDKGYDADRFQTEYSALVQKGKQYKQEIEQCEQSEKQKRIKEQEMSALESNIEATQASKQRMEQQLHELQMKHMQLQLSYEADKEKLKGSIMTMQAWEQQYRQAIAVYDALVKAWKRVQEEYGALTNLAVRVETECAAAKEHMQAALLQKEERYTRFMQQLQDAGFIEESFYRDAKLPAAERAALKQDIQSYYSSVELLQKQIEELERELVNKTWTDLEAMQAELQQLNMQLKQLAERRQIAKAYAQAVQQLQGDILAIDDEIREEESIYQELVDLFEVMKGDNENRISFERYILIEYLEQIVQAANERLRKLSNGQFYLKRSERVEKRLRQSGLGLDVYDSYTGQTRDVKTLSGGEKFNASLCLALGMADVIQAYEGGISIETMFIDEGFGSLDEESLVKAIDTLIDLQKSGRLIGVISHVQELKNALPAVLEVTKRKDGSSKTKFVLK